MKEVYCHFSFRRPRGKDYGIFAAALYSDSEGKELVARKTRAFRLWKNHQHVTAIQSYEHAMQCIWEWQGKLLEYDVTNVLLVTDNSILANWIVDHKANRAYEHYMNKAVEQYRVGSTREIVLPVGICQPRKSEKSHKFCKEELVTNMHSLTNREDAPGTKLRFTENTQMRSIFDILKEDEPEGIDEMKEIGSFEE